LRRGLTWATTAVLIGCLGGAALGHPTRAITGHDRHGFDVSWPQCWGTSAHHMPVGRPSYVILGLTHGLGHTANPCLGSQLDWARSHEVRTGAYLVASYPDRLQRRTARLALSGSCDRPKLCVLRKDGAMQARDALATMHSVGLHAPRVWIDVEFRSAPRWTAHNAANAAVIQGIVRGLRDAGKPMGVYTTSYMWRAIVGRYRLDVPNWLPVGHGGPSQARRMCATTATGGVTWLAQYTRSLDSDLTCPVLDPVHGHHGHLWQFRRTTQSVLSRGPAVRAIQRRLHRAVTGRYGALTSLAVRKWQRSKGLKPTGRFSPVEWRALGAYRRHGGHHFGLSKIAR
jgi:hypothetical protein